MRCPTLFLAQLLKDGDISSEVPRQKLPSGNIRWENITLLQGKAIYAGRLDRPTAVRCRGSRSPRPQSMPDQGRPARGGRDDERRDDPRGADHGSAHEREARLPGAADLPPPSSCSMSSLVGLISRCSASCRRWPNCLGRWSRRRS